MNVIPFKPTAATQIRRAAKSFWAWLLFRWHNCQWVDESNEPIVMVAGKQKIGQFIIQRCSVSGCGKRRQQKFTI